MEINPKANNHVHEGLEYASRDIIKGTMKLIVSKVEKLEKCHLFVSQLGKDVYLQATI